MKSFMFLGSVLLLTSCVSVDMRNVLTVEEEEGKKLPTLEAVYIDATSTVPQYWEAGAKVVQSGSLRATLFYQQIEKNLTDPYGNLKGYIELRDNTFLNGPDPIAVGDAWSFASVLTLGVFNLFGMPMYHFKPYSEINVRVLDKEGRLIKRYRSYAQASEYAALYWGYSLRDSNELLLKTYRDALDKVMIDMKQDYEFLNSRLN